MLLYGANIVLSDAVECGRIGNAEQLYAINKELDAVHKSKDYLEKEILKLVGCSLHGQTIQKIALKEITAAECYSLLRKYTDRFFNKEDKVAKKIRELMPESAIFPYSQNFMFWEEIIKVPKKTNFRTKVKKIRADAMLAEEMDRIYSENHPKQYKGNPVHYKISALNEENAKEILYVLMQGLHVNNRILSKRVTYLKLSSWIDLNSPVIDKFLELSSGGCIVIDLFEDPSKRNEGIWGIHHADNWSYDDDDDDDIWDSDWWKHGIGSNLECFVAKLRKYMGETQLFFVENAKCPDMSKALFKVLQGKCNVIEIKEGLNGEQAQQLYEDLLDKADLAKYSTDDVIFEKESYYSEEDVRNRFHQFSQECMITKIYTAYNTETLEKNESEAKGISSREELERLIGLNEVKQTVKDIIAVHKVDKMRSAYREESVKLSKHMMFSGAPGTAKTTVARLIAKIMKEEGLLKTGTFVECGRADLVGQFVGWTAVQVKAKFKQARGGVLFIDEAYSLVDEGNSFGDEAINTIVAEMENLRDEVIVIFAGYPEKMQEFLAKNEGLKSRIAHHIEFPDYTPQELVEILQKLAADRDFVLDDDAKDKALEIFEAVYREADYGNGRFARNLLEKAIFHQASRIDSMPEEKITRSQLFELKGEDFRYENIQAVKKNVKQIGFAV